MKLSYWIIVGTDVNNSKTEKCIIRGKKCEI